MSEKHHIIQIVNTRSDLQTNLDSKQAAIETDNSENMVFKDDDGTYHILADQKSTGVSGDNTFGDIIADSITMTSGGVINFGDDIVFSNTVDHSISVTATTTGAGKDLTISAGNCGDSESIGGDLILSSGTGNESGVVKIDDIEFTSNTISATTDSGLVLSNNNSSVGLTINDGTDAGISVNNIIKAYGTGISLQDDSGNTQLSILDGSHSGISVDTKIRAISSAGISLKEDSGTTGLLIDDNGNTIVTNLGVGGITSPLQCVHAKSAILITSTDSNPALLIGSSLDSGKCGRVEWDYLTDMISLQNTVGSGVVVNTSGQVGINCAPTYPLDVNGAANFKTGITIDGDITVHNSIKLTETTAGTGTIRSWIHTDYSGGDAQLRLGTGVNTGSEDDTAILIDGNGNVSIPTGSLSITEMDNYDINGITLNSNELKLQTTGNISIDADTSFIVHDSINFTETTAGGGGIIRGWIQGNQDNADNTLLLGVGATAGVNARVSIVYNSTEILNNLIASGIESNTTDNLIIRNPYSGSDIQLISTRAIILNADSTDGIFLTGMKYGATQAASGATAGEVWRTVSHATLPNNVLMIGV
jgi:hypothetical protein